MKARKQMQRGAVRTSHSVLVAAWLPFPLVRALDDAVQQNDSDRSKIIRDALRDKVQVEVA
jgi:metal-responsive CopG/Arc/MetJ family transcriptional regulator